MPAIMGLLGEMAPIGSRRLLAISEEGGYPSEWGFAPGCFYAIDRCTYL